jgi:hypothetical protein
VVDGAAGSSETTGGFPGGSVTSQLAPSMRTVVGTRVSPSTRTAEAVVGPTRSVKLVRSAGTSK